MTRIRLELLQWFGLFGGALAWATQQVVGYGISDSGCGIAEDNLNKIFQYGFTTRKDGHGFGLHSGANAARELGGALTVHSDGPGKGAAFTLELPCPSTNIT